MEFLGEYDPKKVTFVFDGDAVTGFAPDSMIAIEMREDAITPQEGAQGDVGIALNAVGSATVTITLMEQSASLPGLRKKAQAKQSGSMTMNDPSGAGTLASGEHVYIQKVPGVNKGKALGTSDIVFYVPELKLS